MTETDIIHKIGTVFGNRYALYTSLIMLFTGSTSLIIYFMLDNIGKMQFVKADLSISNYILGVSG